VFELGPAPSASVVADAQSLAREVGALSRTGPGKPQIVIRHIGKGRLMPREANADGEGAVGTYDPADEHRDDPSTVSAMVALNGRSGNEFLLMTSSAYLASLSAEAERSALNLESGPPGPRTPGRGPTASVLGGGFLVDLAGSLAPDPDPLPDSWSNGSDDRYRVYGVTTAWCDRQTRHEQGTRPVGRPPDFGRHLAEAQAVEDRAQAVHDNAVGVKDAAYDAIRNISIDFPDRALQRLDSPRGRHDCGPALLRGAARRPVRLAPRLPGTTRPADRQPGQETRRMIPVADPVTVTAARKRPERAEAHCAPWAPLRKLRDR
jgi:hypothetical protein